MSGRGVPARSARTAAVVAVVLVLALVAVLLGLVGSSGSDAVPAGSGTSVRASSTRTTGPAPGAPTRRSSPSASRPGAGADPQSGLRVVALGELPREAQQTVALIEAGGPFPYEKDGVTFGNYQGVLPAHPRGWYREYTVRTPGERGRGPRRVVTGDHDRLVFYTGDHYVTFVQVAR